MKQFGVVLEPQINRGRAEKALGGNSKSTEDSPINVRIFRERQEAAKWLGVPLERLAAKFAAD